MFWVRNSLGDSSDLQVQINRYPCRSFQSKSKRRELGFTSMGIIQTSRRRMTQVWARREAARMRQIAIGKARPEYRRYVAEEGWDGRRERGGAIPSTGASGSEYAESQGRCRPPGAKRGRNGASVQRAQVLFRGSCAARSHEPFAGGHSFYPTETKRR
eukprot:g5365.t1